MPAVLRSRCGSPRGAWRICASWAPSRCCSRSSTGVKLPAFIGLGALTRPVLLTAAVLVPLAIVSTFAGIWLIRRVETAQFYVLVYWLMIALGLRLAWVGLAG